MLKGNLIVGKNQSVVVHAESLRDLVKVAESKSQGSLSLRVDLAQSDLLFDSLLDEDFTHATSQGAAKKQS